MPNPTRKLKQTDLKRLTPQQKSIVKNLKKMGLPVMVYRRRGNKNRLSVHNPLLDVGRVARIPNGKPKQALNKVRSYPHAFDTKVQRSGATALKKRTLKRKGVATKKKPLLRRLLFP